MAIIDADGRLFGRFNIVDAALVALLILALPGAYAAHRLFRDPPARLVEVLPAVISVAPNTQVEIKGEHLRPYMRVSFNQAQGPAFLYYGPTQAYVPLPALEPGTYDVILYDYMREVARLPKALTIVGPPRPPNVKLWLKGAFTALQPDQARQLAVGQTYYGAAGMIAITGAVAPPRPSAARVRVTDAITVPVTMDLLEVPATVQLICLTELGADGIIRCATGGVMLAPDVNIMLRTGTSQHSFRIDGIDYGDALPK